MDTGSPVRIPKDVYFGIGITMKTKQERTGKKSLSGLSAKTEAKQQDVMAGLPSVQGVLDFLRLLSRNNDRDWFTENKALYLENKAKVENLIAWLVPKMQAFDKELRFVDPKKCLYRIYRDIRFSPDKRPYKDYMGIGISRQGRHGMCSGYYIHLQPGECICGAGVYGLEPEKLKKVRDGIYFQSARLRQILDAPAVRKLYGGTMAESARMKVPPKGYDKNFPDIDLLKYHYYFLERPILDAEVESPDFAWHLLESLEAASEFNRFLNEALDF